MSNMNDRNDTPKYSDTEALAAFVKDQLEPTLVDVNSGTSETASVMVVPKGWELKSVKPFLDENREHPERRKGRATLTDLESFIEHVKRFASPASAIFLVRDKSGAPFLVSVLDYHSPGADSPAGWCQHRGEYAFPLDPTWVAWTALHDKPQPQAQFCAFLDEHLGDMRDPASEDIASAAKALAARYRLRFADPSTVAAVARDLIVRSETEARSAVNLQNGDVRVHFVVESKAGVGTEPVDVPSAFLLEIPLFRGGLAFPVPVRLRYRLVEGKVSWTVSLVRADQVLDAAILQAVEQVREATGLPVFQGTPEG